MASDDRRLTLVGEWCGMVRWRWMRRRIWAMAREATASKSRRGMSVIWMRHFGWGGLRGDVWKVEHSGDGYVGHMCLLRSAWAAVGDGGNARCMEPVVLRIPRV